jgi:hypothetical protein
MTSLMDMDALELVSLIRTGKLSPLEVMETTLERIDAVNPLINAFVSRFLEPSRLPILLIYPATLPLLFPPASQKTGFPWGFKLWELVTGKTLCCKRPMLSRGQSLGVICGRRRVCNVLGLVEELADPAVLG